MGLIGQPAIGVGGQAREDVIELCHGPKLGHFAP
jgi:hypothetical protein